MVDYKKSLKIISGYFLRKRMCKGCLISASPDEFYSRLILYLILTRRYCIVSNTFHNTTLLSQLHFISQCTRNFWKKNKTFLDRIILCRDNSRWKKLRTKYRFVKRGKKGGDNTFMLSILRWWESLRAKNIMCLQLTRIIFLHKVYTRLRGY